MTIPDPPFLPVPAPVEFPPDAPPPPPVFAVPAVATAFDAPPSPPPPHPRGYRPPTVARPGSTAVPSGPPGRTAGTYPARRPDPWPPASRSRRLRHDGSGGSASQIQARVPRCARS